MAQFGRALRSGRRGRGFESRRFDWNENAENVPDSTYYIKTDGTDYTCTISGLDPAAIYRMTISYDSSRYYLYGLLKVEGVG